jgi:hypothetical protein
LEIRCAVACIVFLCFRSYEIKDALHDLVPTASNDEIDSALSNACGNADEAAEQLLGQLHLYQE